MNRDYNQKRIAPPIYQHDYHVLKRLFKILSDAARSVPDKSQIIDYGCGTSPYEFLFNKGKNRYVKVDIGENKNADIRIYENKPVPLKNNTANVILSTQVLEHVNNLELYLNEAARLLKKNGVLILSTHGLWPYHPSPQDYYRFTSYGLKSEIEKYRLRVKKFHSILGPYASVTQFSLLLLAEKLKGRNLLAKLLLAGLVILGNFMIWLEDKLQPARNNTDSSVFVVIAQKL